MEEEKSGLEKLLEHLKAYLNTRMDLFFLAASEKTATILSTLISKILLLIILLFSLLFGSLSLSYGLSQYFGKAYIGFLAVSAIYLLAGIIFWLMKDRWIKAPLLNSLIKQFFQEKKK